MKEFFVFYFLKHLRRRRRFRLFRLKTVLTKAVKLKRKLLLNKKLLFYKKRFLFNKQKQRKKPARKFIKKLSLFSKFKKTSFYKSAERMFYLKAFTANVKKVINVFKKQAFIFRTSRRLLQRRRNFVRLKRKKIRDKLIHKKRRKKKVLKSFFTFNKIQKKTFFSIYFAR